MAVSVNIEKNFRDFSLKVQFEGSSAAIGLLGASGSGKSMTLRCIAGIETPDRGKIIINGKTVFDSEAGINLKPQKRRIGYLFQNYALFPTMTVEQNIRCGYRGEKASVREKVSDLIRRYHLEGLEKRLPSQLSGGQQQRVALARIMAYEPDVILLDEPFSALDVFLKDRLQQELIEMLKDYEGTVIMVSHSRDEIYRFSEELLIMDQGKPVIYGDTKEIFAKPVYKEAAKLTGCKNFSRIKRVDAHTAEILDWGITLHTNQEIDEQATWFGYRAHDFVPVWGKRKENCLKINVESEAALPFERNYYLYPEGEENQNKQTICWFLQREKLEKIGEKGMPDYLELTEGMMFLRG